MSGPVVPLPNEGEDSADSVAEHDLLEDEEERVLEKEKMRDHGAELLKELSKKLRGVANGVREIQGWVDSWGKCSGPSR